MRQEDYQVRLDAFQGPLDLLLYLVRRAEVEITDIPIAEIADQYLDFLQQIDQIDVETAADFLLMAATMVEIKSRALRPADSESERGEEHDADDLTDPRSELIQQLLAYKKYREAADDLDERRSAWEQRMPIVPREPDREAMREAREQMHQYDVEDLEIYDLFEAFQRIIQSVDLTRLGEHHVEYDDTPIELHREDIVDRLNRAGAPMNFSAIFEGRSRGEKIGLFLAVLELVKDRRLLVQQSGRDDEITLTLNADPGDDVNGDAEEPPDDSPAHDPSEEVD
jgi:segregation and condensation protein A